MIAQLSFLSATPSHLNGTEYTYHDLQQGCRRVLWLVNSVFLLHEIETTIFHRDIFPVFMQLGAWVSVIDLTECFCTFLPFQQL